MPERDDALVREVLALCALVLLASHPALTRQKSVGGQIDPAGWGGAPANDAVQNHPEGTFAGGATSRALEYKSFPSASIGTSLPWLLPSPKST